MMTVTEWIEKVRNGERTNVALVIVGSPGSGKSVAVRALKIALPDHQINTVDGGFVPTRNLSDTLARFMSVDDITVVEDVTEQRQVQYIKQLVTADKVEIDVKAVGVETRDVKANVIVTTGYGGMFHERENRRFITVHPVEFIAHILPFLAR